MCAEHRLVWAIVTRWTAVILLTRCEFVVCSELDHLETVMTNLYRQAVCGVVLPCVLLAAMATAETIDSDWQVVTIGIGTKPSFDFDAQGRIHVMGMIEEFLGHTWYDVADSIEGPWSPQNIAPGYFYGPGDLRVDANGVAHLAWHNHTSENAEHVRVFPDGSTISVGIDTPGNHDGWDNALAFSSDGIVYQSSIDPINFGAVNSLSMSVFDGMEWSTEVISGTGGVMYGFNTTIDLESDGTPHIAFTRATGWTTIGDVWHAYRDGDSWQLESVTPELSGPNGRFPSLAIDDEDRPHLAWIDLDINDSTRGLVQYGVRDDTGWQIQTVDVLENIELGFDGARRLVSLALDGDGQPNLAYGDRRVVRHAVLEKAGTWTKTPVASSATDLYNGLVVLRLDPHENPAIAFWQPNQELVGVVRIAALLEQDLIGDFDADGEYDADDIDMLFAAVRTGNSDARFDVDGNGMVNAADNTYWIEQLAGTLLGDANFDRTVDTLDFDRWHANLFTQDTGWASGDFNGDGVTDVSDFNLWNDRKFTSAHGATVPEPNALLMVGLSAIGVVLARRPG